jgi:hypothetical protein
MEGEMIMNKKFLFGGIMVILLLFVSIGSISAQDKVADFGDVRVYSYGDGYFTIESDRLQQCLPLTFRQRAGWIEIACSSVVVDYVSGKVGDYVGEVVKKAFSKDLKPADSKYAVEIASTIASWATKQGINYLCNL